MLNKWTLLQQLTISFIAVYNLHLTHFPMFLSAHCFFPLQAAELILNYTWYSSTNFKVKIMPPTNEYSESVPNLRRVPNLTIFSISSTSSTSSTNQTPKLQKIQKFIWSSTRWCYEICWWCSCFIFTFWWSQ